MLQRDVLQGLLEPWFFMAAALAYLPATLMRLVRAGDWASLTSWPKLSYAWFGDFWVFAGPQVREGSEARVVPLLQGRVRQGAKTEDGEGREVYGTVIEIGPGSGMWASVFSDKYLAPQGQANGDEGLRQRNRRKVEKVYGVEPNRDHHTALKRRAAEAGLADIYQIVPTGIQDIGKAGIAKGSIDCIASILCLCSIPDQEANIRELYSYLKPSGRWYVYEHVCTFRQQGPFMQLYQRFLNLFWPIMMGGCQMCRDTAKTLKAAGPWTEFDLAMPVDEPWWSSTPHIYGILTK